MWYYIGFGIVVIIILIIIGKIVPGLESILKVVLFPIYRLIDIIKFIFKK